MITRLLTENEAAILCGYSVSWLRMKRYNGGGPPYRKFDIAVRYPLDLLEQWINVQSQVCGMESLHRKPTYKSDIVAEYDHVQAQTSLLEYLPNAAQYW